MPMLRVGQRVGPYVVSGLLGQGGMAEVYRATHRALEREVAIKVLSPQFAVDPTFPLRFRREAKASARLTHPNIVTVYDFDERGAFAYLVMELADGGTFSERARRFATLWDVVEGLEPIVAAVGYAHLRGIVHRDIKPENVLLTGQERTVLADFGLARIQADSLDIDEIDMILGTPHYMSPEQVRAEDVDGRADIYALGILTYALIAGRMPYDGDTFDQIARQHLHSPPPSIQAVARAVPDGVDAAICRATAKRREDRYPTALEFLEALRHAASAAPLLPVGADTHRAQTTAIPHAAGEMVPTADGGPAATHVGAREAPRIGADTGCPSCGRPLRAGLRFCTDCGHRVAAPSLAIPAGGEASPAPVAAAPRRRRRATSFTRGQWVALGVAALVAVFINTVGFSLARWGRSAGAEAFASGVTTYIFDHLPWFKSALTLGGLLLASLAAYSMRVVVIDQRQRAPELYRKLRQYHRLMGYAALTVAFTIGALTCIGIFGFDFSTTRRAIHTTLGSALLLTLVAKIAVVRVVPSLRRYLYVLGVTVLVLYALVFISSAGIWTVQQFT